jgi:hypothetical protein
MNLKQDQNKLKFIDRSFKNATMYTRKDWATLGLM